MSTRPILHHGETFEYRGYRFTVSIERDDDMGEPWEEHDGHGIVSDWTTREKRPGERILATDRQSRRFYDIQASIALARKDQWGCPHGRHDHPEGPEGPAVYVPGHPTPGAVAACAVAADYERLRRWCTDQWEWVYVRVDLEDSKEYDTLSGIESDAEEYLSETAYELADQILARVEVANPDIVVSEN